ncbi:MAG: SufE family protein [Dysgonamonadaceae bacterium]|jgi:cysteine desulfuration protein SufE|nr:SufE family protein [Dysgonamonadaceae bacterium]
MTLRERQDSFIEELALFDAWHEKFNLIIDYSVLLPSVCPENILPFRIDTCQSRSYFKVEIQDGCIQSDGWSNAGVMRGLIACVIKIFEGVPDLELKGTDIDFHIKSGLINNLTPLRQAALLEMIHRINVL